MSVVYIVCYRQRSVKVRFAETVEKRRRPAVQRTVGTNGILRSRRSGRNRFGFGERHSGGRSDHRNRLLRLKNNKSYTILWSIQTPWFPHTISLVAYVEKHLISLTIKHFVIRSCIFKTTDVLNIQNTPLSTSPEYNYSICRTIWKQFDGICLVHYYCVKYNTYYNRQDGLF